MAPAVWETVKRALDAIMEADPSSNSENTNTNRGPVCVSHAQRLRDDNGRGRNGSRRWRPPDVAVCGIRLQPDCCIRLAWNPVPPLPKASATARRRWRSFSEGGSRTCDATVQSPLKRGPTSGAGRPCFISSAHSLGVQARERREERRVARSCLHDTRTRIAVPQWRATGTLPSTVGPMLSNLRP
jgi:hypothetical protein